jgi:hypothetical protein
VAILVAFAIGIAGEIVYQVVFRSNAPTPAQGASRRP